MPKSYTVTVDGIPVEVTHKWIRSFRLRVDKTGKAAASAPVGMPRREAERFLREHRNWLVARVMQVQRKKEILGNRKVEDGAVRMILGEKVVLRIVEDKKKKVVREGNTVLIMTPSADSADWEKQYDAYYLREAKALYSELVADYTALVEHQETDIPKVTVRRMTSRWGSCTPEKRTIRLNYYLYEAPVFCVEYVALHEVAHLVYPDHSARFYALIASIMPDYRDRKKLLERSVYIGE